MKHPQSHSGFFPHRERETVGKEDQIARRFRLLRRKAFKKASWLASFFHKEETQRASDADAPMRPEKTESSSLRGINRDVS